MSFAAHDLGCVLLVTTVPAHAACQPAPAAPAPVAPTSPGEDLGSIVELTGRRAGGSTSA